MEKVEEENKYKNTDLMGCLHWTLKIMTYGAHWLPKNATKFQTVYFFVVAIASIILLMSTEFAFLITKAESLDDIVECSFMLLTHTSEFIKWLFLYIGRKRLLALLALLETDMFKPKNLGQYKTAIGIRDGANKFGQCLIVVLLCCVFFVVAFAAVQTNDPEALPLKAAWPFHLVERYHMVVFVYQGFMGGLMGLANASTDITATAFMSQVCIQLEILNDDVRNIRKLAEESLNKKKNANPKAAVGKDENVISPELQEEMKTTLNNCVKHHRIILDFATEVQSVFSIPIFFQLFAAVGTMCMTLFQMSMVTDYFSIQFCSLVMYMCCMVMEISVFCWYGNDITVRSEKLSSSVYHTDWVDCSEEYKKMVLFLIVHMQKVIGIRVGRLVDLTLQNLVSVYRTSWSYFLVLYSMRD